jgi:NAD(P)H dehydrogenase (quinone)
MMSGNETIMPDNALPVYAFTGASGRLGRLVLASLLDQVPAKQIIATTRHPELLAEFSAQGVTVRRADFNDPSSLPAAFSGATRLLIIATDAYPMDKRSAQQRAAIAAAVEAGVSHITSTYFSLSNTAKEDDENPWFQGHRQTLEALEKSGAEWTVLNMNIWMEGIPYFLNALRVGERVLVPEGSGKPCWITHEDYARAAASVLTAHVLLSGVVDVTGPESLGLYDLARRWSTLHKRRLDIQILPGTDVTENLVANGMPRESAQQIVGYCGMMRFFDVRVTDTVERTTGKSPTRVDKFLLDLGMD